MRCKQSIVSPFFLFETTPTHSFHSFFPIRCIVIVCGQEDEHIALGKMCDGHPDKLLHLEVLTVLGCEQVNSLLRKGIDRAQAALELAASELDVVPVPR